jgi:hypothetical protein
VERQRQLESDTVHTRVRVQRAEERGHLGGGRLVLQAQHPARYTRCTRSLSSVLYALLSSRLRADGDQRHRDGPETMGRDCAHHFQDLDMSLARGCVEPS